MKRCTLPALALLLTACAADPVPLDAPLSPDKVQSSLQTQTDRHGSDGAHLVQAFFSSGLLELAETRLCAVFSGETCAPLEIDPGEVDSVLDRIVDNFFGADDVLSQDASQVVYALDAREICDGDAECVDALRKLDVRLVVTEPTPGDVDLTVRVDGHDVLRLALHADRVALTADLGEAHQVLTRHADLFDLDPNEIATLDGVVRLSLSRLAADHYVAALDVVEALAVDYATYEGRVQLTLQPATLATVDADGGADTVIASIGFDRSTLQLPAEHLDALFETDMTGVAYFDIGGLTASLHLANTESKLWISDVSLGDTGSSFALNGTELMTLDLNEGAGRTVDVTLSGEEDRIAIDFDPSLLLSAAFRFQSAADQGSEVPAWMLDSTSTIGLAAAQGTPRLLLVDEQVAVAHGTLTLDSSTEPAPTVIEAGFCLEGDANADLDAVHPFSALSAVTCN